MFKQQLVFVAAALAVVGTAQATDFSGKPPFKRSTVDAAEADTTLARLEETSAPAAGERVVEFGGKPPYKRSVVTEAEAEAVSFARLEEVDEPAGGKLKKRYGPPGKYGRSAR